MFTNERSIRDTILEDKTKKENSEDVTPQKKKYFKNI